MWKPVRNFVHVRELPVEQAGLIISPVDLNKSPDNQTTLLGVVEAIGPKCRYGLKIGDTVQYEIGAGEYRMPGDDMVRFIYEDDIMGVIE